MVADPSQSNDDERTTVSRGDRCEILPLIQLGDRLKQNEGNNIMPFPLKEDGVPLLDLVIRRCCKNRWGTILHNAKHKVDIQFDDIDLNSDGVLDKHEISLLMTKVLGYKPQEYVVNDMINSIDIDRNGVIDQDEFNIMLARLERAKNTSPPTKNIKS